MWETREEVGINENKHRKKKLTPSGSLLFFIQRLSVVAVDAALAAAAWVATRHLKSGAGRALSFGLVFAR